MSHRVLGLIAVLSLYAQASHAQIEQESDTILLEDIVIQENRLSYSFSETSRNVSILSKEEIRSLPSQSLPELLSYQPGVDIRQRGAGGVQADIGIRGGTFEQTLILLNGIKMSDPQTGHHLMNVPLMYDNLERIEVLKGSAARIYGQNAYAGAVNFITRVPQQNAVRLRLYGGDFRTQRRDVGTWGGNISSSFRNENHGHYFSIGGDKSIGYRYNTDYEIINGFYQGEVKVNDKGYFDIIAGITDRKFGANGFYASPAFIDQYEEVRTSTASLAYIHQGSAFKITPRLSWRNNRDQYNFVRDNPGVYENLHYTNTYAFETNASYEHNLGTTGMGVEIREEQIKGDWQRQGVASKSNLDGFSRTNIGGFLEHKFSLLNGKLDITPGTYFGWYSDFGSQFFPGIDAGYNFTNHFRVYGNVGRSFRIPTFYDQYYESPSEMGNADLEPEQAWTYDAGFRYLKSPFMLEGNVFLRDNQNLIDWILNTQDSVWYAQNFTQVQTKGFELTLSYNEPLYVMKDIISVERISVTYNKLDQKKKAEESLSRYALEHLADQFILTANLQLYRSLKASITYRQIHRVEMENYALVDGRLFWENEFLNVFAESTNIGNTQYTEVMTPMPGRRFRAGIILTLDY